MIAKQRTKAAPRRRIGVASLLILLTTILVLASPLLAQRRQEPSGPPEIDYRPPWLAMLYAVVFIVAVAAVAFKHSKRTHLD